MPSFQQQVLSAFKAGLATEKTKLELYKGFLKSPDADPSQKEFLELHVRGHQHQIETYKTLIEQASRKST